MDIVDTLVESGAILDLKTIDGHTALTVAVLNQQPKIVSKLLLAGADISIKDKVYVITCSSTKVMVLYQHGCNVHTKCTFQGICVHFM